MEQVHVYEGTLEQLVKQLRQLPNTQKYKMTVVSEEAEAVQGPSQVITFGMFPQLQSLTEQDFSAAEWRGEDVAL